MQMTKSQRLTAERFLGMLEIATDAGQHCPFTQGFGVGCQAERLKCDYDSWEQCDLCMGAVGLDPSESRCPCYDLGCQEAVKRAWLFIEESGILDIAEITPAPPAGAHVPVAAADADPGGSE